MENFEMFYVTLKRVTKNMEDIRKMDLGGLDVYVVLVYTDDIIVMIIKRLCYTNYPKPVEIEWDDGSRGKPTKNQVHVASRCR